MIYPGLQLIHSCNTWSDHALASKAANLKIVFWILTTKVKLTLINNFLVPFEGKCIPHYHNVRHVFNILVYGISVAEKTYGCL